MKRLDGRKLVMLMRRKASKLKPEAFMEAGYLIERLFRIIEELLNRVPRKTSEPIIKNSVYEKVNRLFRVRAGVQRGPTEKDRYSRKKSERDSRRNRGFLKALLERMKPTLRCPDWHSPQIHIVFKRPRMYVDKRGKKHHDYSRIYRCLNSCCRTKYFTVLPKGVELYARVHREVKKMALRWIFHLRGSLSRVRDELSEHGITVSVTTVLRWVKKAGEECVEALTLGNWELWRQPLCIDEKWIKVRNQWHYVFTVVGTIVTDLLAMDLFRHKDRFSIRAFLLKLKALGFDPVSSTTDLLLGYENEVKEVFPQCTYHQCVLHAGRDAKRIVRQSLPDEGEECWRRRLIRSLTLLFKSKKMKQVKKRYRRFMLLKLNAPEDVQKVFSMVEHYFPKLCQAVRQKELPQTTNPVERAIGEFEERYQLTKGFTSFYYAQFFLKAFQIYYRLRKISFGPLKGRNRLGVKHNPIGKLNFADYLTPVISL